VSCIPRPPLRLLALDIDDTIYHWPGEVSPRNREALHAAHASGLTVCFATARHLAATDDFATRLGIPGPLIVNSGATLRVHPHGEVITRAAMTRDLCRPIIEFADERELPLWITMPDSTTYVRDDSPLSPASAAAQVFPVPTNAAGLRGDPVRIIAIGEGGQAIHEALAGSLDGHFNFSRTFRGKEFVGVAITARAATKEAALKDLCERLGIEMSEVLAMGDAEADIGMIRVAGIGVAPANAAADVQAAADVIAPACEEDAVAWVIERYGVT
jgi:Cof subfamily protein (haloacid dehalogenase superfamily)